MMAGDQGNVGNGAGSQWPEKPIWDKPPRPAAHSDDVRLSFFSDSPEVGMVNPDLGETVSQSANFIADKVSAMSGAAIGSFTDALDEQKNAGIDAISSVARSVREAADRFADRSPAFANVVRDAANTIEKVTGEVRRQDVVTLTTEIVRFAKRQPALFAGVGVIAGFIAFRIFRDVDVKRLGS